MQAKIDNVRAMLLRHGYHPRCEQEVLEMGRAHLARGGLHGMSQEGLAHVYLALLQEIQRRQALPPGTHIPTSFLPTPHPLRCTKSGHRQYPCPVPGCATVLPSPSYVTQHLTLIGAHEGMQAWVRGRPVEFYGGPAPADRLPCTGLVGTQALIRPAS